MMPLVAVVWLVSALVLGHAAWRSRRHPAALQTGRLAFAFLFLVGGAATNVAFLLTGESYATFADASYLPFVRDTWHSLVVPQVELWIGLLVAFEALLGVLALAGGRRLQVAYGLASAFHVGLLAFGWGYYAWALPMITVYLTLLRNERRWRRTDPATLDRRLAGVAQW